MIRKLALVFAFLFVAISAKANAVYISQAGGGAGTSCTSAKDPTYFNTAANWTTGTPTGIQIGPGTTVHLCGTFTGGAGTTLLTFQGSGNTTSVITLLFEQNAVLTSPYWKSANGGAKGGGAINLNGQAYIVIDGGTNGIIQNTDNGSSCTIVPTPSPCFNNSQNSAAITVTTSHHVTVKNLIIQNLYVHSSPNDATNIFNDGCVFFNSANNITIDRITAHDIHWCFAGNGNNDTISNSEVYNMDHGVAFGATGTMSGLSVHDNHFHDYAKWDTPTNTYHHDGVHLWAHPTTNSLTNSVVYNNLFDGDTGANVTAEIYLEDSIQNVTVFNNVILVPSTRHMIGLRLLLNASGATPSDNAAYNNFFSDGLHDATGQSGISAEGQVRFTALNNIIIGGNYDIGVTSGSTLSSTGINNELYDDLNADYGLNNFKWQTTSYRDLPSWQAACQCDGASLLKPGSQLGVDSTGHLLAGSPAIGLGQNLSNLATGMLAPLAKDKNGVARPTMGGGNWDDGAYVH